MALTLHRYPKINIQPKSSSSHRVLPVSRIIPPSTRVESISKINSVKGIYGPHFCAYVSAEKISSLPQVRALDIGIYGHSKYPATQVDEMHAPAVRGIMEDHYGNKRPFISIATKWIHPLASDKNQIMYYAETIFMRYSDDNTNYVASGNNPTIHEESSGKRTELPVVPSFLYSSGGMTPAQLANVGKLLNGEVLRTSYDGGFAGTFEIMDVTTLQKLRQKKLAALMPISHPLPIAMQIHIENQPTPLPSSTDVQRLASTPAPMSELSLAETKRQPSTQEDYSISPPSGPLHIDTGAEPEFSSVVSNVILEAKSAIDDSTTCIDTGSKAKSPETETSEPLTSASLSNSTSETKIPPPSPQKVEIIATETPPEAPLLDLFFQSVFSDTPSRMTLLSSNPEVASNQLQNQPTPPIADDYVYLSKLSPKSTHNDLPIEVSHQLSPRTVDSIDVHAKESLDTELENNFVIIPDFAVSNPESETQSSPINATTKVDSTSFKTFPVDLLVATSHLTLPQKDASSKSLLESITPISESDIPATVASNVMPEAKNQSFDATQQPGSSSSNLNVSEAKNSSAQANAVTAPLTTIASTPLTSSPLNHISLAVAGQAPNGVSTNESVTPVGIHSTISMPRVPLELQLPSLPVPTTNIVPPNSQNPSISGGAKSNLKAKKGSCTIL